MSSLLDTKFEVVDHNVTAGYVTMIVDLWDGDRGDPAVSVNRYIGVWRDDVLENDEGEAINPDFTKARHRYAWQPTPEPLVWEIIEETKKADKDAQSFKRAMDALAPVPEEDRNRWTNYTKQDLFAAFTEAVEVLAVDDKNQEAWAAVDAWRQHLAHQHER